MQRKRVDKLRAVEVLAQHLRKLRAIILRPHAFVAQRALHDARDENAHPSKLPVGYQPPTTGGNRRRKSPSLRAAFKPTCSPFKKTACKALRGMPRCCAA